LQVRQVSANVTEILGVSPEMVLGKSFQQVLGAQQFEGLRSQLLSAVPLATRLVKVPRSGGLLEMNCVTHRHDGVLITELELRAGAHSLEPLDIEDHIGIPLYHMETAADILELSWVVAAEIQRLSGFDRVMVYRFDEEWNGEVVAEVAGSSTVSYLGLRFPASDIPPQARQLFLVNTLRVIADVATPAVSVVPEIGPLTGRPLDLTRSLLRSASPIHLEYLRNMGVRSSLTISVIVEGRLPFSWQKKTFLGNYGRGLVGRRFLARDLRAELRNIEAAPALSQMGTSAQGFYLLSSYRIVFGHAL
jgi:light-regulated signal transduction histidine kinase (bacteriophytochrome)